ncbi:MAG: penicillin-binding protein 2 [Coriobacteriales bacterium]|jgi:cell division protein FtsI (penicillin-binding protein 3)|nr:penicillin-binding protein 2 [Coriobacteriales bacterium]
MSSTKDRAGRTSNSSVPVFLRRDRVILALFILLAVPLCIRLFTLTVVDAQELSEEGSLVRTSEISLTARRGTIYDRNGNVLATSVDATTIYANPSKIEDPKQTAGILHEVLGGTTQDYYEAISADPELTFVYIAKKVDPEFEQALHDVNQDYINEEVAAIQARGDDVPPEIITPLTGIEFLPDTRREYPKGATGAQIIGAVNDEGVGVSGLEQCYDSILCGVDGMRVIEEAKQMSQNRSPLPMIDSVALDVEPVAGSDIIISLDIEMQQYLELNLQAVASQRDVDNASTMLLDGSTGEIVATASIPLYDRDTITTEEAERGATNAKAITLPYEPGSTFKALIAGMTLEQGLMTADDTLFCPAYLEIYDKIIKDSVDRPDLDLSLRQIVANSSNIGVSLLEMQLGDELFYDYLTTMGFGELAHVDYPGETAGTLASVEEWSPVQAANIAFGQGLEVSLLQMASMYGAIANDGIMVQPHFLIARPQYDVELSYGEKRVFNAQTARDLEELLRSCVTEGYGVNAAVEGYEAVGKTGTAEIGSLSGGYDGAQGNYVCSFVGYLDNSTSNYVFMSSFENPSNYANSPATTFFSVVMSFAANRYMIQPQAEAPVAVEAEAAQDSLEQGTATPPDAAHGAVAGATEPALAPPTPKDWLLDTSG